MTPIASSVQAPVLTPTKKGCSLRETKPPGASLVDAALLAVALASARDVGCRGTCPSGSFALPAPMNQKRTT